MIGGRRRQLILTVSLVADLESARSVPLCEPTRMRLAQFELAKKPTHRIHVSRDKQASPSASSRATWRDVKASRDSYFDWLRVGR
jgi:hypothetical protein